MKKRIANDVCRSEGACCPLFPTTSRRFEEIARNVISEYIQMISRVSCSWEYFGVVADLTKRASEKDPPKSRDRVLMIMESPHISEYEYSLKDVAVVGLAQQCGHRISKHFNRLFQGLMGFDLFVVNAIPFQCSLGTGRLLNCLVKNKVVQRLLGDDDVLNELMTTVRICLNENRNRILGRSVIVNACGSVDVHNRIENALKKVVGTEDYWRAPHPCTWTGKTQSKQGFTAVSKFKGGSYGTENA